MIDYHVHTKLCKHASGEPEQYISTAISKGFSEIGFADHCPFPIGFDPLYRMNGNQFPEYKQLIFSLKETFKSIQIKYAIEIDWVKGKMNEVFAKIAKEPFDYLIGSVHYTDDFPFDNPEIEYIWKKDNTLPDKVWPKYLELVDGMVSSEKLNIIGHFDIPKKFGYFPSNMDSYLSDIYDIFKKAAANEMAIEINSSGLRKPVKEIYPSLKLLKLAKEAGLYITFGSDAHAPEEVGADFDRSIILAKEAGFSEYALFTKKSISLQALPE